jgi:DNA polymerase elongation subunit (family B)
LHLKDIGSVTPKPCDIIKPVGVELVRSTMSTSVKDLLRNVVKTLLYTRDREKTVDVFRDAYEEFKKLPPEEIAFRSGIKTYNKYSKLAVGFTKAKRTPVAVAGAIYCNNLLKEYNIESKYEKLTPDMRVKWVYCNKNNKYSIENIAFLDKIPTEFVEIETDYDKMFMKIMEPAIERLFECAHWKMVNLRAEYTVDLLDFFKE